MFIYLDVILIFSLWLRLMSLTLGYELSCLNMMSAPDRNYDEGNRELLEVVVARQEWRHWLEGTQQPFIIWKDDKNILYLLSARCLNSRQACCFLCFSCFSYTLSYQPCSQNSNPEILSQIYTPELSSLDTEPIVPTDRQNLPTVEAPPPLSASRHPPFWCTFLPFVEYIHNSFTRAAFPFIQAYLSSCKEVRQDAHAALTHFFCRSQRLAGLRRSPAPQYQPGQKIWL